MPRTQQEVDALWEKNTGYSVSGEVTLDGATSSIEAATELQKLYEGSQAVAGMFVVTGLGQYQPRFIVQFTRDVCDDADVVNGELLAGKDFNSTLLDQLRDELTKSAKEQGVSLTVHNLDAPVFEGYR